jgi:uncharacterized lipoprotein YbaY
VHGNYPFALPSDPGDIEDNHTYSLRVRIEDGSGKLLIINQANIPLIIAGNPT